MFMGSFLRSPPTSECSGDGQGEMLRPGEPMGLRVGLLWQDEESPVLAVVPL